MPIIKSAIKRMKQNRIRYARNRHYSSNMKSMMKLFLDYVKKGELDKANKILPKVISAIDVAAKKNLIHENNAAHKKSRMQKALTVKDVKPAKAEPKAKAAPKEKVEAKAKKEKTEKKEDKK